MLFGLGEVMATKKFHLITTTEGCITNLLENSSYRENLIAAGLENTKKINEADVVIINTCGYTTERENYTLDLIDKLKAEHPQKEFIVGGCLPKINEKRMSEVHSGEHFAPGDIQALNRILKLEDQTTTESHMFDSQDFDDLSNSHQLALKWRPYLFKLETLLKRRIQPLSNLLKTTIVNAEYYSIVVSQGCKGKCTFCAIKNAKGEVKSKPINKILDEFHQGLQAGHQKFWLVGDDIGCYGVDIGTDFSHLLDQILKFPNQFELVINYFEPMFFIKQFSRMEQLLQDQRVLNINFPIQSGSAPIVRRMGREYDPKIVLDRIQKLKKMNHNLVVKTNIIVGFPGETNKDFWQSLKSVFSFDAVLAIPYTARPGTGAMKYKDHVSEVDMRWRMIIINSAVLMRHSYVALRSFINFR